MLKDHDEKPIGNICNYYGGLSVKVFDGVPYWSINNWDGHDWDEITEDLYNELIKFEDSQPR